MDSDIEHVYHAMFPIDPESYLAICTSSISKAIKSEPKRVRDT